jgi:hypothetical protein
LKARKRKAVFTITHNMLQNAWTEAIIIWKLLVLPVVPTLKSTRLGWAIQILEFSFVHVVIQIELGIMSRFRGINISILMLIIRILRTYIPTNVKDWPIASYN